jgi:hypothetical protein
VWKTRKTPKKIRLGGDKPGGLFKKTKLMKGREGTVVVTP